MAGNDKLIIALLVIALIGGGILAVFSISNVLNSGLENNASNYAELVSKQNPNDICAVPPGTDPQEWREHLSHHPEQYAQCLK